jgi:hypothetical protein
VKISRFLVLFLLLSITQSARAADDQEVINQIRDYVIERVTYEYCSQIAVRDTNHVDSKSFEKIKDQLDVKITDPLELEDLRELLKENNFSDFTSNYLNEESLRLIETNELEKIPKSNWPKLVIDSCYSMLNVSKLKQKGFVFDGLRKKLESDIIGYLKEVYPKDFQKREAKPNPKPDPDPDPISNPNAETTSIDNVGTTVQYSMPWIIILITLSFIPLAFLIYHRFIFTKRETKIKRRIADLDRRISESGRELKNQRPRHPSSNSKVEERFDQLEEAVRILSESLNPDPKGIEVQKEEIIKAPIPPRYLYTGKPNKREFTDEHTSETKGEYQYYRIILDPSDPSRAEFEFYAEGQSLKDALENIKMILGPVSKVEGNSQMENISRIINVKPGSIIRENGVWKVEKEVVVRYE